MPHLKKELPPDVLEIVCKVEEQADECWRALQILQNPSNVVVWALLTGGIAEVEREQAARGSNTPLAEDSLMAGRVSVAAESNGVLS